MTYDGTFSTSVLEWMINICILSTLVLDWIGREQLTVLASLLVKL